MASVQVHGHTIELEPLNPGEIVTDVIVLCRAVATLDNGALHDKLTIDGTEQTTGIIQRGMFQVANEGFHNNPDK